MYARKAGSRKDDVSAPSKVPDTTYPDLASQGVVSPIQAEGMQSVRRWYDDPKARGYTEDESKKVSEYRKIIPEEAERLFNEGYKGLDLSHKAHVYAAAKSGTAAPSGSVLYHSGEVISGAIATVISPEIATSLFGPASKYFNNPIGDAGKTNRNVLSATIEKAGSLLERAPSKALKTAGGLLHATGVAIKGTDYIAQLEYSNIVKAIRSASLESGQPSPRPDTLSSRASLPIMSHLNDGSSSLLGSGKLLTIEELEQFKPK